MALFQCFFFLGGHIAYWENIDHSADVSLPEFLKKRLVDEGWHVAEASRHNILICRVEHRPGGLPDCSPGCPMQTDQAASLARAILM